jgi:hypothetical protein
MNLDSSRQSNITPIQTNRSITARKNSLVTRGLTDIGNLGETRLVTTLGIPDESPLNQHCRKLLEQMDEGTGPDLPVMTLVLATLRMPEAQARFVPPARRLITELENLVADAAEGPNREAIRMLAPDEFDEYDLEVAEQTLLEELKDAQDPIDAGMVLVERLMLSQAEILDPRQD